MAKSCSSNDISSGGGNDESQNAAGDAVKMQKNGNRLNESLESTMNAMTNEEMKLKAASRKFGILASSLRDHLYGKTIMRQRGNPSTLKLEEEKKLVDYIFEM